MDRTACSVIHSLAHCTHCQLTAPTSPAAPGACFDDPPKIDTKVATRTVCRAGLPCDIAPLHVDEVHMANLFVGGYVSSTRDRKRLFERLLASSVPEAQARLAVREMPVMTRREIDGLVRLMAAGATSILESAVHSRQAAVKTRELEVIVGAGREFIERRGMGPDLLEAVLERGMDIISADSGSLMMVRSGTDLLEVVAPRGGALRNAAGEMVRIGEGIAGRVAESGRSVLITGASDPVLEYSVHPGRGITTSVSVPLMHSGVVLGVINLNSSDPDHVLTGEDLLLVEQYASFAASVIRNARLHETTERRMYELMQLS
ncbi:MAG: GAF domain-containing protein, partial [Coriobacteriia bacterium]|nr:GAF domain-containing protein [Coriobacteriia bacterium]